MKIEETLSGVNRLFLDTAPVIYYVENNPRYLDRVRKVFEQILESSVIAVASPVTLAECLVLPYNSGQVQIQQEFIQLILNTENIEFELIDNPNIALEAAQIRAKYNLQLLDAFQIAVALAAECEAFLTNDAGFRRVTELTILLLDELEI
ncbi:MAG: type II toxin-antitoxin system VapC family toxin [Trichodesmium sp.]